MAIGIVKVDQTASATAKGNGNPVLIVGSSTGRDGIHGATFASEEISEKSEAKRPSVLQKFVRKSFFYFLDRLL